MDRQGRLLLSPTWTRSVGRALRGAPASLFLALCVSTLSAQQPTLTRAERLVEEGRTAEARELVATWWDAYEETAGPSELQLALWLRGRLTLDPDLAAADYQRLATEFRGGPYSDDALLRLALAAEAGGDLDLAVDRFRTLAMDYPTRATGREAAAWLDRHAPALMSSAPDSTADAQPADADPTVAGEPVTPAVEAPASGVEREPAEAAVAPGIAAAPAVLREPSEPTPDTMPVPDAIEATPTREEPEPAGGGPSAEERDPEGAQVGSTAPPPVEGAVDPVDPVAVAGESDARPGPVADSSELRPPAPTPALPDTPAATLTLEVGAYLSELRAERMIERLEERGHTGRIVRVPGSPRFRVRVGTFPGRTEAEQARGALEADGFSARVESDVALEERVSGSSLP